MYRPGFRAEGLRLARDLKVKVVGPLDGLKPSRAHGRPARDRDRRVAHGSADRLAGVDELQRAVVLLVPRVLRVELGEAVELRAARCAGSCGRARSNSPSSYHVSVFSGCSRVAFWSRPSASPRLPRSCSASAWVKSGSTASGLTERARFASATARAGRSSVSLGLAASSGRRARRRTSEQTTASATPRAGEQRPSADSRRASRRPRGDRARDQEDGRADGGEVPVDVDQPVHEVRGQRERERELRPRPGGGRPRRARPRRRRTAAARRRPSRSGTAPAGCAARSSWSRFDVR